MAEDRHHFSDPRPVTGLVLPTWDVDVFRDGVPEPILTLRVDETNLPPRKSKKKKVVWKLPDEVDQVPRFGIDEKRRLLELFKNAKKERRKEKDLQKRSSLTEGMTDDQHQSDSSIGGLTEMTRQDTSASAEIDIRKEGSTSATNGHQNGSSKQNGAASAKKSPDLDPGPSCLGMDLLSLQQPSSQAPPSQSTQPRIAQNAPPGVPPKHPPPGMLPRSNSLGVPPGIGTTSTLPHAPPGIIDRSHSMPLENGDTDTLATSRAPPPGMASRQHKVQSPAVPKQTTSLTDGITSASTLTPPPYLSPPTITTNPLSSIPHPMPTFPIRYFSMSPSMPHELFGQEIANIYLTLLRAGQVDELLHYYTMTAQKSLSLKSAHSICVTRTEMQTQLQSLVGSAYSLQGLTVQQGPQWLVLVCSGLCQMPNASTHHCFCQTLVLVPAAAMDATTPVPYQIQNDALVLLTGD